MKLDELLEKLNDLKHLPRTGWLFAGESLKTVEDVAQHSFEVATVTLLLSDEIERAGIRIDKGRAISMAVMHDWAESLVTDFPYPAVKYLESARVKTSMEDKAFIALLGKNKIFLELWDEYRGKKTLESKLVHAADYISLLVQAVKYREKGNRSHELENLWRAVKRDLGPYVREFPVVKKLVADLNKRYQKLTSRRG